MSLPPPDSIPLKHRASVLFVERGQLDVLDGAFVIVDKTGVRTQIPIGGLACVMLEPGTRVSHAAVTLAARVGCLLVWVGEGAVRVYSSGAPGGARSDRLLHQARVALDPSARLRVVRRMYAMRFGEEPPERRSVDQLRGMEGARVKRIYENLANKHGVVWKGRRYNPRDWGSGDVANQCLSAATACLYGVAEAAILVAGYSPAIGFIHSGKPLSFVYDIADVVKFETVVPVAFRVAAENPPNPDAAVRHRCRDMFRETKLLERLIPLVQEVLAAGGPLILDNQGVVAPAIVEEDHFRDDRD